MKIQIRQVTLKDISAVVELLSEMEQEAVVFLERATEPFLTELITDCPAQGYVAEDRGEIVGCVFLSDNLGIRHHLAVRHSHRRRGIASAMVKALLRDYRSRTQKDRVETIVAKDNPWGLAFNRHVGATEIREDNRFITFSLELKNQPWLLNIRPADLVDIPAVVEFLSLMEAKALVSSSRNELSHFLVYEEGHGHVAVDAAGAIKGCVFIADRSALLRNLGVDRSCRRHGVASRLVRTAMQDYSERTGRKHLKANVSTDCKSALDFWGKFGTPVGNKNHWIIAFHIVFDDQDELVS